MVRDRSIVSKGVDACSPMKVASPISLVSAGQAAIPSQSGSRDAPSLRVLGRTPMRAIIKKNDQETCNVAHPEWLDLREDPGAIARIDCARQYPNLRALLLNLNADESPFTTFGCTVWASTEALGAEPNEFASRIGLVFSQGTGEPGEVQYADLARRLAELLESEPGDALRAELQISPAKLTGGRQGFCLRLFLFARGAGEKQAQLRWNLGLVRVQQALLFLARAIRQKSNRLS
jgi:hypothetical protein